MSKFYAWSGSLTNKGLGIPLQIYDADKSTVPDLERVHWGWGGGLEYPTDYFSTLKVNVLSTLNADWSQENLLDGNISTCWSSRRHGSAHEPEELDFWFGYQDVNLISITPRTELGSDGFLRPICLPHKMSISYSDGVHPWRSLVTLDPVVVSSMDRKKRLDVEIHLDETIRIEGLSIIAKELTPDAFGDFYFQVAEVRVGKRRVTWNESLLEDIARQFPEKSYFLGDEPDGLASPQAYAESYHRWVEALRTVAPNAKCAPAGFAQRNAVSNSHFIEYAESFWRHYCRLSSKPKLDEWRLHCFVEGQIPLDQAYKNWEKQVREAITWCKGKSIPMVLGSFGFGVNQSLDVLPYLRKALELVKKEDSVTGAVYWGLDTDYPHTLTTPSNHTVLSKEGLLYKQFC